MPTEIESYETLAPVVQDYPVLFSRLNAFPADVEAFRDRIAKYAARKNCDPAQIKTRALRMSNAYGTGTLSTMYFVAWFPGVQGGLIYNLDSIGSAAQDGVTGTTLSFYDTDGYTNFDECVMVSECYCDGMEDGDDCDFCYSGNVTCRSHDSAHI